jgi:hypothetical protein
MSTENKPKVGGLKPGEKRVSKPSAKPAPAKPAPAPAAPKPVK